MSGWLEIGFQVSVRSIGGPIIFQLVFLQGGINISCVCSGTTNVKATYTTIPMDERLYWYVIWQALNIVFRLVYGGTCFGHIGGGCCELTDSFIMVMVEQ